jgi:hypothetical protein
MVVRLNYIAHAAVDNVIFNMYLYWPSGYLCAQLGTGRGTSVPKGSWLYRALVPVCESSSRYVPGGCLGRAAQEVIDGPASVRYLAHRRGSLSPGYPHATTTTA